MADTPEELAEKVRKGLTASDYQSGVAGAAALDALLARLAEAEKDVKTLAADLGEQDVLLSAAEADRDRYKAANLTAEEARIVLIGLDGYQEMGWDGAPYTATLQSAIDKLEQQAGDLEQATVHLLQHG